MKRILISILLPFMSSVVVSAIGVPNEAANPTASCAIADPKLAEIWQTFMREAGIETKSGELPVGIAKQVNGGIYVVALDSLSHREGEVTFGAFASLTIPGAVDPLAFAARDIAVGPGGLNAAAAGARLELVSEHAFPLFRGVKIILPADGGNYVEWDCNGFKSINLKGIIEFSENMIVPADTPPSTSDDGTKSCSRPVRGTFEVHAEDLDDMIFRVDMPAFRPKDMDIAIDAHDLILDLSSLSNSSNMIFPQGYECGYEGGDIKLWRGFYARRASLTLPKELQSKKCELKFMTENLIIDNMGVSLRFSGSGLGCPLTADNWPFTVESLKVEIMKNRLTGGGLTGQLSIPLLGYDSLGYQAEIYQRSSGWDYVFAVRTVSDKTYNLDPLGATLVFAKGSTVKMERIDHRFTVYASLNGTMAIDKKPIAVRDVKFQTLCLQSKAPYITDGIIDISSRKDNKMGGFPISFDSIHLDINAGKPELYASVNVNFMNENSFTASTGFHIYSEIKEEAGSTRWQVKNISIDDATIAADIGSFKLAGKIGFYRDHETYGDGFSGMLKMSMGKLLSELEAQGYFGIKDDFRYWQASIRIPFKIPLPPVPTLYLTSLRGGVAYRMTRPAGYKTSLQENAQDEIGEVYIPDKSAGLSFLTGAGLGFAEGVLSAKSEFGAEFRSTGGLKSVTLKGDAAFLVPIKKLVEEKEGGYPVSAYLDMKFDNDKTTFDASLKTYVNLAGVIKGSGANNLVGEAAVHFGPNDWYIYIGRPSVPFSLDLLKIAKIQSYFMMGTKIEAMPPVPDNVSSVVPRAREGMLANQHLVNGGRGFCFGSRFNVDFGFGQNGGFLYAYIALGAGADVMLRNYGSARCEGRTGTVGVDGWYASGQAYVYMVGKLGIRAMRKKFDILSLSVAALLQAELPNPSWFYGGVGAKYRLLGGLVKGSVHLDISVGEKCTLVMDNSDELGIKIIGDISPASGSKDVNVFASPQAAFNTSVGKEFSMMNVLNQLESYRVTLDEFSVTGPNGIENGVIEWNDENNLAIIKTHEVLTEKSDMKMNVKIHVDKKEGSNVWKQFADASGKLEYETASAEFKTGAAPDYIDPSNVKYTYPIEKQYNFLTNEYNKGYIMLDKGQGYLFRAKDEAGSWEYAARFVSGTTAEETSVSYDEAAKTVNFGVPGNMQTSSVHNVQIMRRPSTSSKIDENLKGGSTKVESSGTAVETEITENKLEGVMSLSSEKSLYTINFRTSKYKSFAEKMAAASGTSLFMPVGDEYVIGLKLSTDEKFDATEKNVLVKGQADGTENWYTQFLNPVMYNNYGVGDASIKIGWRDVNKYGVKPLKAISIFNHSAEYNSLTENQITTGSAPNAGDNVYIQYDVPFYTVGDYSELINKAANKYQNPAQAPANAKALLNSVGYVGISDGTYGLKLKYVLPGINKETSSIGRKIIF